MRASRFRNNRSLRRVQGGCVRVRRRQTCKGAAPWAGENALPVAEAEITAEPSGTLVEEKKGRFLFRQVAQPLPTVRFQGILAPEKHPALHGRNVVKRRIEIHLRGVGQAAKPVPTHLDRLQRTLAEIGDEPDPADYGVWVPGIPVLIGDALDAAGTPEPASSYSAERRKGESSSTGRTLSTKKNGQPNLLGKFPA